MTLIDQLTEFPAPPLLVFTGGDPFKRSDIFSLIAYALDQGLKVAVTPSATSLVTTEALRFLKDLGIHRMAVSLDGMDAATHDHFRGWSGSFQRTMDILEEARDMGIPLQVNTTITRHNVDQVDAIADWLSDKGLVLWSVFFLVPVGRGMQRQMIPAAQYEHVFAQLHAQSKRQPYAIKTTEAHHYRRYVLQNTSPPEPSPGISPGITPGTPRGITSKISLGTPPEIPSGNFSGISSGISSGASSEMLTTPKRSPQFSSSLKPADDAASSAGSPRRPLGINDGKGVMFVSDTGEIFPSGFMPIDCGRFPRDSVVETYQNHPTFQAMRRPENFHGKCGVCEFNEICGGSRARAYAVTGDPLGSEPDCVYEPQAVVGVGCSSTL